MRRLKDCISETKTLERIDSVEEERDRTALRLSKLDVNMCPFFLRLLDGSSEIHSVVHCHIKSLLLEPKGGSKSDRTCPNYDTRRHRLLMKKRTGQILFGIHVTSSQIRPCAHKTRKNLLVASLFLYFQRYQLRRPTGGWYVEPDSALPPADEAGALPSVPRAFSLSNILVHQPPDAGA
ncbi:hypothetical protein BC830DRAFT_856596 [Chytriomyces sp. MP71]|nr:hypothetical protein BC830DRAFT_856596 [Chytriomyces sp. MP71]